jgi:ATP-binding cassette, subfamily C, type I secretion system permease/ATPase
MVGPGRSELGEVLRAMRGNFAITGVFSFFINLLMLTAPLYMLQVYDRVLTSRSVPTLVALTVLAGALLLVMGLLDLIRSRVLVRTGASIDQLLHARVFSAVFQKSLASSNTQRGQPLSDLDSFRQFLTGPGPFALFDAPWVPVYLLVVFLFHPVLGFIALAGAVLLFALAVHNEILTRKPLGMANREVAAANAFAVTSLRNADALAAMGMLPGILRRWSRQHDRGLMLQGTASDGAGSISACTKAIRMFLQVAILGAGASLAIDQIITPGAMIAASIIMGRALAPVEQAIGHWRGFLAARAAYSRLNALLLEQPAHRDVMQLPAPNGRLEISNLVAGPPGLVKPVLRGVSFSLEPGEALGVIGPSASGKSTLARLLVGVWPPTAGMVRLDSAALQDWRSEDLGPFVGYLPQDVELFEGTVAENIGRFSEELDPEAIVRAARQADVHDMILHLPDGYNTNIGENGSALSGGQRQRLGLARALYGDPVLVVLDEPNANLDAAGDEALTQAILDLKGRGATVVVMAHRPSAIAAVDKLLFLLEGRVMAFGPKEEVLAESTVQPSDPRPANQPLARAGP